MAPDLPFEAMGAADLAWLRMDDEENRLVITALLGFDEPLDMAKLEAIVRDRLLRHARFRERPRVPAFPLLQPRWELDEHFDLRNHLHHVALPRPADENALRTLVSDVASTPLDMDRPLWQVHLIDGPGNGSTVVARVHHCIGDGVALIRLLLGLTDEGRAFAPEDVGVAQPKTKRVRDLVRAIVGHTRSLAKILLLPRDPPNALKGPLLGRKRVAWSRGLPLDELKLVAHGLGVTLNDVFLGALAGALRGHLISRGVTPPRGGIKALVPVYVRAKGGEVGLGNRFGLVFAQLPVDLDEPIERVRAVASSMGDIKHSPEPTLGLLVLGVLGRAGRSVEHFGVTLFTNKATVMTTNIPGPTGTLTVAGRSLRRIMVWAPVGGSLGLAISFLTYRDELRLGLMSDEGTMRDPETIVARFEAELGSLGARIASRPGEGDGRSRGAIRA